MTQQLSGKEIPTGKAGKAEKTSGTSGEFAELLGLLQASLDKGQKSEKGLNLFHGSKSPVFSSGDGSKEVSVSGRERFSHFLGDTKNSRVAKGNISDNLFSSQDESSQLNSTADKKAFFSDAREGVKASAGKDKSAQLRSKDRISEGLQNLEEKIGLRDRAGVANDSGKADPKARVRIGGDSETARGIGTGSDRAGKETAGVEKQGLSGLNTGKESKNVVPFESKEKEGFRLNAVSESQAGEKATRSSVRQQMTQTLTDGVQKESSVYTASKANAETTDPKKTSQSKETRGAKSTGSRIPISETGVQKASDLKDAKNAEKLSTTGQPIATKRQAGLEKSSRTSLFGRKYVENAVAGQRAEKVPETQMVSDGRPAEAVNAADSDTTSARNMKTSSTTGLHQTGKETDRESHVKTSADTMTVAKNETHVERESQNIRGDVQGQATVNKTGESGLVKSAFSGTQMTGAEIFRQVQDRVEEMLAKFSWPATHRARLSLNPPSLGALDIEVEVRGEHVKATFLTASPVVKEILDSGMDTLRQSFSQSGMDQSETNVFLQQGNAEGRDSYKQNFGNKKKSGSTDTELKTDSGGSDSRVKPLQADGNRLINVRA